MSVSEAGAVQFCGLENPLWFTMTTAFSFDQALGHAPCQVSSFLYFPSAVIHDYHFFCTSTNARVTIALFQGDDPAKK